MLDLVKKTPSYELFLLVLCLIFASNIVDFDPFRLLFLVPILFFIYLFRISLKWMFISLLLSGLLVAFQWLLSFWGIVVGRTYFSLLNRWIPLNKWILDYLDHKYPSNVSDVIGSVLFNRKGSGAYKSFSEFGVAHLLSVSALHFSTLRYLLFRLTKSKWVVSFVLTLYWVSIDYSIPALRVLLSIPIREQEKDSIRTWSLASLMSLPFNWHIYTSTSFLMSYFFSLLFALNRRMFASGVVLSIVNALSVFVLSNLFSLTFYPRKIYPLSLVNTLIFTPIILSMFLYFLLSWFVPFLLPVHLFFSNLFTSFGKALPLNAASIPIYWWDYGLTCVCLSAFGILWVILLGRCCDFTTQRIRDF